MEQENIDIMDRILMGIWPYASDIESIRRKLQIILDDYEIKLKETALTIYTEGKNEMFLKRFLLAKAVAGRQERTIKQYAAEIGRTLRRIGKDADTITSIDMQVYLAKLIQNGDSKSYCDTVRRYMNSFFGFLYREELIKSNPMNKVDAIKFHREKETAFTDLEIEKMRVACKNNREKALLELLLSTGCRASEVVSIKKDDISGDEFTILGKGGKYRTVYLNAKARIALNEYLKDRVDKNPYLFAGGVFGKTQSVKGNWYKDKRMVSENSHMNAESVNSVMKSVAKRAGVEGAHAHRFRRTCATMALRHGMPIEFVSMMLGHEQISTTQIYLDVQEADMKNAHKKFVV